MPNGCPITDADLLNSDHLQIPCAAAREVGAAAFTLAALYRLARSERGYKTFASVGTIAEMAAVDERTCHRHLKQLTRAGYVGNLGREPQSAGSRKKRRTCTYKLLPRAHDVRQPYLQLPRFAAQRLQGYGVKLIFGVLVSHQMMKLRLETREEFGCFDDVDMCSTTEIANATGLTKKAIRAAKWELINMGWALGQSSWRDDGGEDSHYLQLNPDCNVQVDVITADKREKVSEVKRKKLVPLREKVSGTPSTKCQGEGEKVSGTPGTMCHIPREKVSVAIKSTLLGASSKNTSYEHGPKNTPETSSGAVDLLHFELKHIQDTCLYWYGKLGAPDGDCRNLWKISALVTAGRLTQAQVASAVEGVRMCHPSNRLAYFYTTLSNALTLLGRDLKAECANVRTEPQCPKAPPKLPTYSKELRKVCTSMAPPEEGRNYEFTDVELDRRNRALIAQLVAAETGNSR